MKNQKSYTFFFFLLFVVGVQQALQAQKTVKPVLPLAVDKGRLVYTPDPMGNSIPDFSYCGYKASEQIIPHVPIKIVVPVAKGDATLRIQSALDYVAGLPMDAAGFRGTVLLEKGTYEVLGVLTIKTSGVVLRGSGITSSGTTLIGTGDSRATLVGIRGKLGETHNLSRYRITTAYVPVNATSVTVDSNISSQVSGSKILIQRPSTQNWINLLGTAVFGGGISALGWKPGDRDLYFERNITKIAGNVVSFDAPITTALDSLYGGGSVSFYNGEGKINNCGIENIRLVSTYDKTNLKDENHRWNAIDIENAEDAWVRQVSFENFAGSAVHILETGKRITVEDCISLQPVSEIGGQRRYTFLTRGQQTLFQRCYAEKGYHDFAVGYCAPGPNAFVQCESMLPYSFSGTIDSWASGVLFDLVNVTGNALRYGNRGQDANGAGWTAANSVFWNCTAAKIDCYKPPGAQNWSFGSWAQFNGDGYWGESNNSISPRSLYYAQLAQRLNKNVDNLSHLLNIPTEASSSPSVETAQELTRQAAKPMPQLKDWIFSSSQRNPIPTNAGTAKKINQIPLSDNPTATKFPSLQIKNGVLVRDGRLLFGHRHGVQWWSGGDQGRDLQNAKPHITRFVPGRTGTGLTDDLNEVTDEMKASNTIVIEHNYGLWYDRRRDDHQRVKRMDGEVWTPFYELPFARSGKDTAWDGLSKYDLTKYNPFYWNRLKEFADLADQKGLLLIQQHYFQHNIIEAGAHFADFPWRTANNINNTGFPEPVPYAGDKRIFMSAEFYDLSNRVRRELHRKYIRQCLDNFASNNGVIHLLSEEYTGPTHFVKFWLDVIKEWENETGKHPVIGLSVTKDVQDSILNMPAYAAIVDLVDIRYWHYQADGTSYAPKGGQNLAPRQHARLLKPKKTSFEQVYRAVKEYKDKFPAKAVMYSGDNYPEYGVAVLMAGGSLPVLPAGTDPAILRAVAGMRPAASTNRNEYILSDGNRIVTYNLVSKKWETKNL